MTDKKDYARERRIALSLFAAACIGKDATYQGVSAHDGNCQSCALLGTGGGENVCDEGGVLSPNYAGWARLYVQAGRTIPNRFALAFTKEIESDNRAYARELADDIAHYGLTINSISGK